MGQEISSTHFNKKDFTLFQERLEEETRLLRRWFDEGYWAPKGSVGGFELEAWLVNHECRPSPSNETYLDYLGNPLVVPELARFNVELNTPPHPLHSLCLGTMERELSATWTHCQKAAEQLDLGLTMIGILPSVTEEDLCRDNMSRLKRYAALNEQVLRLRQGRPLVLEIRGKEYLRWAQWNVMLESAATSFQIHIQVDQDQAVRFYNASIILSAPMVAACANSPYLFGKDLWDETRIPLFEQSVSLGEGKHALDRVTFGSGYARDSLFECFQENLDRYPVLLPMNSDEPPQSMAHVRLHNGTLWRWNRPLIGFEADGRPHLRIEHRVVPSGPSVPDSIANAAFYYGLVHMLGRADQAPEGQLSFEDAKENFYRCARLGLDARVNWLGRKDVNVRALMLEDLLPGARQALLELGLDAHQVDYYLGIVRERLASGRTGAAWQRAFVNRYGPDMRELTCAYCQHSRRGVPVHEWIV